MHEHVGNTLPPLIYPGVLQMRYPIEPGGRKETGALTWSALPVAEPLLIVEEMHRRTDVIEVVK
jgi:hypothetical protein